MISASGFCWLYVSTEVLTANFEVDIGRRLFSPPRAERSEGSATRSLTLA